MSKLLSNILKGTLDFIMPSGPSIDEPSVRVSDRGPFPQHERVQQEHPKTAGGSSRDGKGLDKTDSVAVEASKADEEGERSNKRRDTRDSVEGRGSRRTLIAKTSAPYIRDYSKKRKEAAQESARELAKDVEALREQLRSSQKDLVEANIHSANADKRIKTLESEKTALANQYKIAADNHSARLKAAHGQLAEVEARNRKQEEELRIVRDKLRVADEKNHNLGKLLEERTADFKGTQTFMTTADSYSGAEIISMVDTLNAEIFQIAAFTAELVENDTLLASSEERNGNIEQYRGLLESASRRLGQELSSHLLNKYIEVRADPLPLQLAIQALLSHECMLEIRSFRASDPFGDALDQLYRRIKVSEAPAVAGRWRAITSTKLRDGRDRSRTPVILNMVVGLLCLCGLTTSNLQSRPQILTLQKMLYGLEKLQMQLKTAIKEGVTTADMEVFSVAPGSDLATYMEDAYAETLDGSRQTITAAHAPERRVLSTVGLGLRKSVTKVSRNGESRDQIDVLLRPKVALLSVLRDVGREEETHPRGQDGK